LVSDKAVRVALYKKLNVKAVTDLLANGSASIIHQVAPDTASYPMIIFNQQTGEPHHQFGGSRYDEQTWMVKAVEQGGSSSAAEDIAAAVDAALDWQLLSIEGGESMQVEADSKMSYSEVVDGEPYRHHVALYRLVLQ
jgi:hypothetical protein